MIFLNGSTETILHADRNLIGLRMTAKWQRQAHFIILSFHIFTNLTSILPLIYRWQRTWSENSTAPLLGCWILQGINHHQTFVDIFINFSNFCHNQESIRWERVHYLWSWSEHWGSLLLHGPSLCILRAVCGALQGDALVTRTPASWCCAGDERHGQLQVQEWGQARSQDPADLPPECGHYRRNGQEIIAHLRQVCKNDSLS